MQHWHTYLLGLHGIRVHYSACVQALKTAGLHEGQHMLSYAVFTAFSRIKLACVQALEPASVQDGRCLLKYVVFIAFR